MIKDTKKILKMAKYIPGIKTQAIMMSVLFCLGLLYEFTGMDHFVLGGMYLLLPCSIFFQIAYTGNASSMMQASPLKKYSQTMFPYVFAVPFTLIIYTFIVLHRLVITKKAVANDAAFISGLQGNAIILLSMILFVTLIYMALCYKIFVVGLIAFFTLVMFLCLSEVGQSTLLFDLLARGNMGAAIAIGYAIILVGAATSVALAFLLYKRDLSKFAIKSVLRTAAR